MPELTRAQKTARLLEAKFGSYSRAPWPLSPVRGPPDDPRQRATHVERMQQIEAEELSLRFLPAEELDARFQVMADKEQRQAEAHALYQESQLPFNLPSAAADSKYWAKADYWTADEATALLLGKSPDQATWEAIAPCTQISEFAKRYASLRRMVLRATALNQGQAPMQPTAVIAWADSVDIEVPTGLRAALHVRRKEPSAHTADVAPQAFSPPDRATVQPEAHGAGSEAGSPGAPASVVRHSTKTKRRDPLDTAIELAQSRCKDANDTAEVWGHLQVLAQAEHPPLLAVTPEGLKYTKHGVKAAYFTRDALDKRLHPEKRQKRREPPQPAA